VKCPSDYRLWLQSMYTIFGQKWLNLYSGPMWKVVGTGQEGAQAVSSSRRTADVRVHVLYFFLDFTVTFCRHELTFLHYL